MKKKQEDMQMVSVTASVPKALRALIEREAAATQSCISNVVMRLCAAGVGRPDLGVVVRKTPGRKPKSA